MSAILFGSSRGTLRSCQASRGTSLGPHKGSTWTGPHPAGIGEPGPGSSSLLCTLGLREAPLGPAAVGAFRLEVVVNRTHFTFRIDLGPRRSYDSGSEDLLVAMAAYEAACRHWPGETVTLRQGTPVIEDSRKEGLA